MKQLKRLKNPNTSNDKNSIRLIMLFSIAVNLLLYLAVIAVYPPVWYTNDDYRMMTIVSGAYTGTPSADIVFMRYPVGLLLSGLYSVTTQIPWYGVFTMLCMFVPSCIVCYYIVKKAYLKNRTLIGVTLYLFAFLFLIRKYICLPQFTLTSAFLGVGAAVLILEMPVSKNIRHIIFAVLCATLSFSVRTKAFYLLIPMIALVVLVRLINEKGTKIWKSFAAVCLATLLLCGCVNIVDNAAWYRNSVYQDYKAFNVARSSVYDYGSIPAYYDNMPFYTSNGISETAYRSISSRYLDLDKSVDTQTLNAIGDYIQEIRTESGSFIDRLIIALEETIEYWFDSGDEIVKYSAIFVFILLGVVLMLSVRKKKINIIFPATVAGFILESVYLEFSGRLIVRLVDMLLLAAGMVGCLSFIDALDVRKKTVKEYILDLRKNKYKFSSVVIIVLSVIAVLVSSTVSLNVALRDKYYSATVTQNARLNTLKDYAKLHPDSFFLYDSSDFISCTEYVFKTYGKGEILNHDSMGSWNCNSPTAFERNEKFGFSTSAAGRISDDCDVYFVTTTELKMGITKTLKDNYNKKLKLVDNIQSNNYVLNIYMVVDDD